MNTLNRSVQIILITFLCGCSSAGPSLDDMTEGGDRDAQWQKRYEQQCIAAGVQPGTPMMVKCIDDLTEIGEEQPDR